MCYTDLHEIFVLVSMTIALALYSSPPFLIFLTNFPSFFSSFHRARSIFGISLGVGHVSRDGKRRKEGYSPLALDFETDIRPDDLFHFGVFAVGSVCIHT